MPERRSSPRIDAGIPVEFDTATAKGHVGILQDVSEGGALLLSSVEHYVDEPLTVRFRAQGTGAELIERAARVVRSEPHDTESIWAVRCALVFDHEVELDPAKLAT